MAGVKICQISRGVAPAQCIAEAVEAARMFTCGYYLITRLPACDAKNAAVKRCLEHRTSMLLVEDDVIPTYDQWDAALQDGGGETVLYAEARTRAGCNNVCLDSKGNLLFTGTVFVYVPHSVLIRLPTPAFEAWEWQRRGDEMFPTGPSRTGKHSDVFFWRKLLELDPKPEVRSVGKVVHVKHAMNDGRWNLHEPCELGEW